MKKSWKHSIVFLLSCITLVFAVQCAIAEDTQSTMREKQSDIISGTNWPTMQSDDTGVEIDYVGIGYHPYESLVFGSEYERSSVTSIRFLNSLDNVPENAWDISEQGDGSVLAWISRSDTDPSTGSILTIAGEGGVRAPADCSGLFSCYDQVIEIDFNNCFDTSGVTSMSTMFTQCKNLTAIDVSSFDTSCVTNMYDMFYGCHRLKALDLSTFNTMNVTNMNNMFNGCSDLEELNLSSFNTSNVTDMTAMFSGCSSLESLDLSSFDTSRVTSMYRLFCYCVNLQDLDISSFDISDETSISMMFCGCRTYWDVYDILGFAEDGSRVLARDISYIVDHEEEAGYVFGSEIDRRSVRSITFSDTLTDAPDDAWDVSSAQDGSVLAWVSIRTETYNTGARYSDGSPVITTNTVYDLTIAANGKVIANQDCGALFSEYRGVEEINFNGCFETSQVTNMRAMFFDCYSLASLDLSGFDTSQVTNMDEMFVGCTNLTYLDLSNFDTSKVEDTTDMFEDLENMTVIGWPMD